MLLVARAFHILLPEKKRKQNRSLTCSNCSRFLCPFISCPISIIRIVYCPNVVRKTCGKSSERKADRFPLIPMKISGNFCRSDCYACGSFIIRVHLNSNIFTPFRVNKVFSWFVRFTHQNARQYVTQ